MITLKQAFEDLYDRMLKQIAEKMWEIERAKPLKKAMLYSFAGKGIDKKKLTKRLNAELEERQENLSVLKQIMKNYAKPRGEK